MMTKLGEYLKESWFKWLMGILIMILLAVFNYVFASVGALERKMVGVQEEVGEHKVESEKTNLVIQTQLSQIQTDLQWIREKLKEK